MSQYDPVQADEEYTSYMLKKEQERWHQQQRHMEGQILCVIDTTLKTQDLVNRDKQKMKEIEEMRQKKLHELAEQKKKRDEKRLEAYKHAQEREKEKLRRLRQMMKKHQDKLKPVEDRQEDRDDFNSSDHRDEQRNHPQCLKASVHKSDHVSSQIGKSQLHQSQMQAPEYIKMMMKTNCNKKLAKMENQKIEEEVQKALEQIQKDEEERDRIIQGVRVRKQSNLDEAFRIAEENRLRASQIKAEKLDKMANNYIQKVKKVEKFGELQQEEVKKKTKQQEEDYKKAVEKMKQFVQLKNQQKREKLQEFNSKKEKTLKNMQRYLENQKRQIKKNMEQNNLKKQMVKHKHNELLQEWIKNGTDLMDDIKQKYETVQRKKQIREEIVERRKKMLEELQLKKEEFRKKFEMFNEGSEESQKKAIEQLKAYGLVKKELIERLQKMDEEEERLQREEEERKKKLREEQNS